MTEHIQHQDCIQVVVRIARRGGGEVSARHAEIVAKAATTMLAHTHVQPPIMEEHMIGAWASQGRAMIGASHDLARRPMQPRSVAVWSRTRHETLVEERAR